MSYVELRNLTKTFGAFVAVDNADLRIQQGEFYSLLGPSGCGKTTTLRMLGGFSRPTRGQILIGGQDVTYLPPERRGVGIVFQNYAIFPHMNVYQNIAFGLQMRKVPPEQIRQRVLSAIEQVGLSGYERRYEREMSGGEQQRVALARVLVTEPSILLLDEPLSALDKKLREEMKFWIKDLQHELKITTIYVTHDQGEALTLSDRMAVMNEGKILQVDSPTKIYERPVNRFVAGFIGESNILSARVAAVEPDGCRLEIDGSSIVAPICEGISAGQEVSLMVRPEHFLLGGEAHRSDTNRINAYIRNRTFHGDRIRYGFQFQDQSLFAEVQNRPGQPNYRQGEEIPIGWLPESTVILTD